MGVAGFRGFQGPAKPGFQVGAANGGFCRVAAEEGFQNRIMVSSHRPVRQWAFAGQCAHVDKCGSFAIGTVLARPASGAADDLGNECRGERFDERAGQAGGSEVFK